MVNIVEVCLFVGVGVNFDLLFQLLALCPGWLPYKVPRAWKEQETQVSDEVPVLGVSVLGVQNDSALDPTPRRLQLGMRVKV